MKKLLLAISLVTISVCTVLGNDPNNPPTCGVMDLPGIICPTPTPIPLAANTPIPVEKESTDGEIVGWIVLYYYLGRF